MEQIGLFDFLEEQEVEKPKEIYYIAKEDLETQFIDGYTLGYHYEWTVQKPNYKGENFIGLLPNNRVYKNGFIYQFKTEKEAKQMMENQDVIIVDVRREDEYAKGHIPHAVLVPNETIKEEAQEKLPDKNATYLVYCRSGNRSAQASRTLIEAGYQNIYDFGGIQDWPYEIEGEQNE